MKKSNAGFGMTVHIEFIFNNLCVWDNLPKSGGGDSMKVYERTGCFYWIL